MASVKEVQNRRKEKEKELGLPEGALADTSQTPEADREKAGQEFIQNRERLAAQIQLQNTSISNKTAVQAALEQLSLKEQGKFELGREAEVQRIAGKLGEFQPQLIGLDQISGEQPETIETKANKELQGALEFASNFVFDPLKPASESGQEAIKTTQTRGQQGFTSFNQKLQFNLELTRGLVGVFARFAAQQYGRATGTTKALKDSLSQQNIILGNSLATMGDINQAVATGATTPATAALAYASLLQDIQTSESAVKAIAKNNPAAYISGARDNLLLFNNARQVQIPILRDELQQAIQAGNVAKARQLIGT